MRRFLRTTLLVLAVGLIAWLAMRVGDESRHEPESRGDVQPPSSAEGPGLTAGEAGADRRSEPEPEASAPVQLHGVVRAVDGRPLANALVYVLAEGVDGSNTLDMPHAETDAQGAWALAVTSVRGAWLCAQSRAHATGYVPGDRVRSEESVEFVLEPAPTLAVTARLPDGEIPAEFHAYVATPEGVERQYEYPGPEAVRSVGEPGFTRARAPISYRIGSRSPVVVSVHTDAHYAVPEKISLPRAEGQAEFELQPDCWIEIVATQAETKEPFPEAVTVYVYPQGSDEWVAQWSSFNAAEGIYDSRVTEKSLRPGRYRVRLESDGYRAWEAENVVLAGPGEGVTLKASMMPDVTRGRFRLTVRPLDGDVPMPAAQTAYPIAYVRRQGTPAWQSVQVERAGETWTSEALPEGDYDVLVWEGQSRRVGFARGVRVVQDEVSESEVALSAGVTVPTAELPGEKGQKIQRLVVHHAEIGDLPRIGIRVNSWSLHDENSPYLGRVVLGPYPGSVEVHVGYEGGETLKRTWPGAPVPGK